MVTNFPRGKTSQTQGGYPPTWGVPRRKTFHLLVDGGDFPTTHKAWERTFLEARLRSVVWFCGWRRLSHQMVDGCLEKEDFRKVAVRRELGM